MTSGLFIWAFIQSFVIGGIVILVRRTTNNYILSGIFVVISLNTLFQYVFRYTDAKYDFPRFLLLTDLLDFLLPPLVFWYVDRLLGKKSNPEHYWYFLPPLVFLFTSLILVLGQADFTFEDYIGTTLHKIILLALFFWKVFMCYQLFVTLKADRLPATIKQPGLLQWPRLLMVFVGITSYIALVQLVHSAVFVPHFNPSLVAQLRKLVQLNYILFNSSIILFTIYFSLKYPVILSREPIVRSTDPSDFPEGEKYREKLNRLIEKDQVHLNNKLNEKVLADQMGIPSYVLSRLLNEYIGKSFSEFINEKRVEAAKSMLKNERNKKLTNFAVAMDSGFRSESVFYLNFKKTTGMTPTQYKKSVRKKVDERLLG